MSADALEGVHLIAADEVFRRGYPASTRLAVCGESVTSAPDGDEADPGYCGDCVSAAIQRSHGMDDPCPRCGSTRDVKVITGTSPKVQAWECGACGTEWAITAVNPRSYLDYLVATVELAGARSALRALLTLADDAPRLPDAELRSRLTALAGRAVMRSR
ncbi:MAG TPA: hypothetical protein VFO16_12755 [Pseudonocardiaceae bacterium]|nr:hypothetical protein [Pseudonocardiaceae bacterium]